MIRIFFGGVMVLFLSSACAMENDTPQLGDNVRESMRGEEILSCAHSVCVEGDPLDPTCSTCAETVCNVDPFCCEQSWDGLCVSEANDLCGGICTECAHDTCEVGGPLEPTCNPCVATVCAQDAFCCKGGWDDICVREAESLCGLDCTPPCAHDVCEQGERLDPACDPCVEKVCAQDPFCCEQSWDALCVAEAEKICGPDCTPCGHDLCEPGEPLEPTCDPCVEKVCGQDPFCCDFEWDSVCVGKAEQLCGLGCNPTPR